MGNYVTGTYLQREKKTKDYNNVLWNGYLCSGYLPTTRKKGKRL